MDQPIFLEKDMDVADLVLNRPAKRNALTQDMWAAIPGLVGEVADDQDIKVLILRGATPEAFAAGADIAEFPAVYETTETARAYSQLVTEAYNAIATLTKPTVAMVQGICFGGGCALALACDFRYADPTAKFCIPPARLGLVYSLPETKRLVDLIGPSRAKEMLMGARVVKADEAVAIGLATRLFPSEGFDQEVRAFVDELCNLSQYSIRAVKTIVKQVSEGVTHDTDSTRALWLGAFETPDYEEGRDAFLEKRKPNFTYR